MTGACMKYVTITWNSGRSRGVQNGHMEYKTVTRSKGRSLGVQDYNREYITVTWSTGHKYLIPHGVRAFRSKHGVHYELTNWSTGQWHGVQISYIECRSVIWSTDQLRGVQRYPWKTVEHNVEQYTACTHYGVYTHPTTSYAVFRVSLTTHTPGVFGSGVPVPRDHGSVYNQIPYQGEPQYTAGCHATETPP